VNAATIPCATLPPVAEVSLDDLVARGLCASELAVCSAYAAWTKQPLLVWVAKLQRGAS
jgi:hypothetical protein